MSTIFGPAWEGSPMAQGATVVPLPEAMPCQRCDEPFVEGDSGIVLPLVKAFGEVIITAEHRECYLRGVFGSVEHQQHGPGQCPRTCVDDPKLSKREAARAAVAYFALHHGRGAP